MTDAHERLQRLLEEDRGGDVRAADRLAELERLAEAATGPDVESDLAALTALANDTRYRIVSLLAAEDDELCVCEFAPLLDVSESAVSHALRKLVEAGLVGRRKDGRWRFYWTTERAEALLRALDETRPGMAAAASPS
jgi:DNA-binding transcriptional ArsR family regulator